MKNAGESVPNAFLMREKCVDENSAKAALTSPLFSWKRFHIQAYSYGLMLHCSFNKLDVCFTCLQIDQLKQELSKKESELLALQTKLETLNNQNSDCKQHIEVLKESLTAKEQRAAILQTEVMKSC